MEGVDKETYDLFSGVLKETFGLIGVGKSVLTEFACDLTGFNFYKEDVSDWALKKFYSDKEFSLALQFHLMVTRRAVTDEALLKGGWKDRSDIEDRAFAHMMSKKGMISQSDYECYEKVWKTYNQDLPKPLIIHLDAKPETCLERIRLRNRKMETGITLDYLTSLQESYAILLEKMKEEGYIVLTVPWEKFIAASSVVPALAKHYGLCLRSGSKHMKIELEQY